jgi:formylmethanofuran dehydrogenase subunit C
MDTVTVTLVNKPELYIEAYNITPDAFAGKSLEEIGNLECHEGNYKTALKEFFTIAGKAGETAESTKIIVKGDCSRVKRIGQKMTAGEVVIEGNADMYTAGWMIGGKVHVTGNVDAFCGIQMEGGEFIIDGNADNHIGSSYRGDWRGMRGGLIRVGGNAGSDVGTFMIGGTIIIEGDAGIHIGTHAEGGTIIVKGNAMTRVGGQMVKGDIYIFGDIDIMMPGFRYVEDVEKEVDGKTATFASYIGDLGERHPTRKGEVIYGNLYQKI